jgi:hypothetical protein
MKARNANLDAMHRLLHRHCWTDVGEWARAIGDLADLTDDEIERVAAPVPDLGRPDARCGTPDAVDAQSHMHPVGSSRAIQPPPRSRSSR